MQIFLGLSKSYVQWKNNIFKLKYDLESDIENTTWDLDIPKSNPHGENED